MEEPMTNSAEVVPLLVDLKREMDGTQLPTDVLEDELDDLEEDEEDEDSRLMIDDQDLEQNVDDPSHMSSDQDEEEGQVMLEHLPRPVNELNCRQARTFLVKLLRTANGGMNPHYGNPDMKPAFWPDYYWPWEKLTDVHTKPRGMNEPLQYSEMMKLAIARGYQYFGYDPNTYVDLESESDKTDKNNSTSTSSNRTPIMSVSTSTTDKDSPNLVRTVFDQPPPRLPRPLSKLNCVQSRTTLARLLRYQQAGNNPVYGSPETRPPWWPDHMIRWVDMVDLRGKPPYLPDFKTYTDVLKQSIKDALEYYGYDSETYLETNPGNSGLLEDRQKAFPVIKRNAQPLPPIPSLVAMRSQQDISSVTTLSSVVTQQPQNVMLIPSQSLIQLTPTNLIPQSLIQLSPASVPQPRQTAPYPTISITPTSTLTAAPSMSENMNNDVSIIATDDSDCEIANCDDDEEDENFPPKLPMPIGKMNCSMTRTVLAKLIRFHCGNQLPNYGNPSSMPCWWPNHLIDWMQIKNLSHRYEGYLGNTYSNCLRIAVIRGYAHYGLDANEHVEKQTGRPTHVASNNNNGLLMSVQHQQSVGQNNNVMIEPVVYMDEDSPDSTDDSLVNLPGSPVISAPVKVHRKPLPSLLPISHANSFTNIDNVNISLDNSTINLENDYINLEKGTINLENGTINLDNSNINLDNGSSSESSKTEVIRKFQKYPQGMLKKHRWFPPRLRYNRAILQDEVLDSLKQCKVVADRSCVDQHLFTDCGTTLVHARPKMLLDFIRNDLKEQKFTDFILRTDMIGGKEHRVHKLVLAAHSSKFCRILKHSECDGVGETSLVLAGVDEHILEVVVNALYNGQVVLNGREELAAFEQSLSSLQSLGILVNLRPCLLRTSDSEQVSSESRNEDNPIQGNDEIWSNNTDDVEIEKDTENNFDEEFEWEVWSFCKPGPRRSKRIPIPKSFSSIEENNDPVNPTVLPADPIKVVDTDEFDSPLALNRSRRKTRQSDDPSQETGADQNSEIVVDILEKPQQKLAATKRSNKKEEERLQQAVKTSPRLKQKMKFSPDAAAEPKSKKLKMEIPVKQSTPTKQATAATPSPKSTTNPLPPGSENEPEEQTANKKCKKSETASRCTRKSITKTSPVTLDRKRSRAGDATSKVEEADSPNFEAVSEDLLNDKVKEGQVEFVKWLMEAGFLRSSPPWCCDTETSLQIDEKMSDGVAWSCPVCKSGHSVRSNSIFGKSGDESLCWIMRLILCWTDNTSLLMCQQTTGADIEKIFFWYDLCREYFGRCGRNAI